jgi:hypothetical protein
MPQILIYLREELMNFCIEQSLKQRITTSEYIKRLVLKEWQSVHNT